MVNSGILVMLHITLSDVICDRMMLNLSAIVMLTAGVLSSAVGAWQSVQKALRNEIQIEI